jgi:hypothetical protein
MNPRALSSRKDINGRADFNPEIIFVAAIQDFQLTNNGRFVPDKFDYWRQETAILKLSSVIVVMPFSNKQKKNISHEAVFIEPFIMPPSYSNFGIRTLFHLAKMQYLSLVGGGKPLSISISEEIWTNFLVKTKPRVIMGIGLTEVLLEVSRNLGIKTIEYQHGIFGESDFRRWWLSGVNNRLNYPDLFMTWDDYYSDIARNAGANTLTIGYPYCFRSPIEKKIRSTVGDVFSRELVVVTLSCREVNGIDKWGMVSHSLDISIQKLLKLGYRVLLRIHPMAEKGKLRRKNISRWLNQRYPGSKIIFPSDESIISSLKGADVHLTVSSSTILEAAYIGIQSLILSSDALKLFPPRLTNSGIIKLTSPDSILQDILSCLNSSKVDFQNPLDIKSFQEILLDWTSHIKE